MPLHFTAHQSTVQFSPLCNSFHCALLSTVYFSPLYTSLNFSLLSTVHFFPLCNSFHCELLSTVHFSPLCNSFHCALLSTVHFSPLCTFLHCALLSTVHSVPLCTSLHRNVYLIYALHTASLDTSTMQPKSLNCSYCTVSDYTMHGLTASTLETYIQKKLFSALHGTEHFTSVEGRLSQFFLFFHRSRWT